MTRPIQAVVLALSIVIAAGCGVSLPPEVDEAMERIPAEIRFNRDVRPILSDRCFKCHGPDGAARATNMRLDSREGSQANLIAAASSGRAIDPGDPGDSELVRRILSHDPAYHMPPPEANLTLTHEEKAILIRWIEQGAEYEPHWAFTPPVEPRLPDVSREDWALRPLDRFVLARLDEEGLAPSPEADRETLLRRVSFDLTGLPPSIEEMDAFLADDRPDAYERAVDRLLASPAYGERMASAWLDLARYADSHGYQDDGMRNMWPWRDWVVKAHNQNLPYDEFVTWQMAGDLLPGATQEQILATGFNRNHLQSQEGGIVAEEYRVDYVADRTHTFGRAFLGLTVECARCHAHKYDPIGQEEYYGLFAFFNSINEFGNIPYSGEAAPVVILTDSLTDSRLADVRSTIARLEGELTSAADPAYPGWLRSAGEGAAARLPVAPVSTKPRRREDPAPTGLIGHYPLEGFVEVKDRLDLADLVKPKEPGYFWGDRDQLPELIEGVAGQGMRLQGDGWLDMGGKRFVFERNEPFTLSLWVRLAKDSTAGPIMGKSGGLFNGKRGYLVLLNEDGTLSASLNHVFPDNSIEIRTTDRLTAGAWRHVALTYDGSSRAGSIRLFLDGRLMASDVVVDNLLQSIRYSIDPATKDTSNWGGSGNLAIGYEGGNLPIMAGLDVDEFRVFDRQLAGLEVAWEAGRRDTLATLIATPQRTAEQDAALREYHAERVDEVAARLRGELKTLRGEENSLLTGRPSVMVLRELSQPRDTHILARGAYDAPGDLVQPTTPGAVLPFPDELPRNRLGLATWLFDEKNPLTARVAANRLWQIFFGRGIVATSDNLGFQGTPPTHPELLDHLAVRLREEGWDTKAFLKELVTSATYRQSSLATPELAERDPFNRLLARGPSVRLSAEQIRDAALAASGLLVREIGGPPVKPYQPDGLWEELATRNATVYVQDHGNKLYRRSLYTIWKRTTPPPSMISFDAAERNLCIIDRQRTNTPLQALVLMNDVQYVEASRILAERVLRASGGDDAIERAFRLLTGRRPRAEELAVLRDLRAAEERRFAAAPRDAVALLAFGEKPRDATLPAPQVAAMALVASTIMNMDAFVTKR